MLRKPEAGAGRQSVRAAAAALDSRAVAKLAGVACGQNRGEAAAKKATAKPAASCKPVSEEAVQPAARPHKAAARFLQ